MNFNTQKEKQMKKKMKRMQMGGMAMPTRGTMPNEREGASFAAAPVDRPAAIQMGRGFEGAMPVRGGGGVPLQGPGGVIVKPPVPEMKPRPERPSIRGKSMRDLRAGVGPFSLMDRVKAARGMKGGGLARKGVGMALAKGGLVKANGCAQRGKTKGRMM